MGLHQAVADGAVGGLAEVAALGVLQMGASRDQLDVHVRQRRAGEHARMGALEHVGLDQPLPVQRQIVHVALRFKGHAAAPRPGRQPQPDLGVVLQRLVVADADGGGGDGLHVQDARRAEVQPQAEAIQRQTAQNLRLNAAHHPQAHVAA